MKKHTLKIVTMLMATLLALCLFASCGARTDSSDNETANVTMDTADTGTGSAYQEEYGMDDVAEAASEKTASSNLTDGRKLIRTVDLTLQTRAYDALFETVKSEITKVGGYVEHSSADGYSLYGNNTRYSYMTARIPSDQVDAFLKTITNALGDTGSVVSQSESVEDITLQYTDTESRKTALETEQKRLLELLEQAESVEDIITIETRLSDVRYELENYGSQLRVYDNQVDYSTVGISIDEVELLRAADADGLFTRMQKGIAATFGDIADGAENFAVFIVVNSPYLLILAVVIILFVWWLRRKRKVVKVIPAPTKEESTAPDSTDQQ